MGKEDFLKRAASIVGARQDNRDMAALLAAVNRPKAHCPRVATPNYPMAYTRCAYLGLIWKSVLKAPPTLATPICRGLEKVALHNS